MSPVSAQSPHHRTLGFMQTAFGWTEPPTAAQLLECAQSLTVTVHARPDLHAGQRLPVLALVNVLGRLPVPIRFVVTDGALDHTPPPFEGSRVVEVLANAAHELPGEISVDERPHGAALRMTITDAHGTQTWAVLAHEWMVGLHPGTATGEEFVPTPVSAYLAACAAGGEVLRAWARHAADLGVGRASSRLARQAAPGPPFTLDLGPQPTPLPALPAIDWVSAGAVNQATLAVLLAYPELELRGRVVDPKELDPPDLNRSLQSVASVIGRPKAAIAAVGSALAWQQGAYPEHAEGPLADWVVTGTDHPGARARVQQARPRTLIVTATESVFGVSSAHRLESPDPCGACEVDVEDLPGDAMPTTAPTSAAAGVLTAARLLQLAAGVAVSPEASIATWRIDTGIENVWDAEPDPACTVCAGHGRLAL